MVVWAVLFPVLVKTAAAMTIASTTTPPIIQPVYLMSSLLSLRRFVFGSNQLAILLLSIGDPGCHLRRILQAYARYYNKIRTHRSLDKDAPISRPVQRIGNITSHALLGGLHRQYVRV